MKKLLRCMGGLFCLWWMIFLIYMLGWSNLPKFEEAILMRGLWISTSSVVILFMGWMFLNLMETSDVDKTDGATGRSNVHPVHGDSPRR